MCIRDRVDENGKEYHFPAGIAHFLEHKMFEMKDGDVMDAFSTMGANVNAFTSYTAVSYTHLDVYKRQEERLSGKNRLCYGYRWY